MKSLISKIKRLFSKKPLALARVWKSLGAASLRSMQIHDRVSAETEYQFQRRAHFAREFY